MNDIGIKHRSFPLLPLILETSAHLGAYKVEIIPGAKNVRVIAYSERGSREFMRLSKTNYSLLLLEVEDYLDRKVKEVRIGEAVFHFSLSLYPSELGDLVVINFHK
ncbi:hypothetical protein H5T88_00755 [bacterium]|nr:hypothetical protein [bacterium]